jgi:hypothetical protein
MQIKTGSESRVKLIAAAVLMVLALVLVGNWIFGSMETPSAAAPASTNDVAAALAEPYTAHATKNAPRSKKPVTARSLDPTLRYDWLKASEDTEYKGSGRNIFQAQVEIPKPQTNGSTDHAATKQAKLPPQPPPGPPPPPPIDLKFFGFVSRPGEAKRIFLSQGDNVFIASEGEIIDRRYKILRISPMSVEVEDVLNNNRQEIPLTQS